MSVKNVLVTGGAGFIGSNMVIELLKSGYGVKIIDNFSTGKKENIIEYIKDIEIINGDIRDFEMVKSAVKDVDIVFHQAALPSVPRSINDPITSNDVNVNGSLNIFQASKEEGVKKIMFASSSSIYGDNPILPKTEDMVSKPLSPYAVSKLAAENYLNVYSRLFGMETVALRYFNVFGPRQDPNSLYSAVIPKFIAAVLRGESPIIFGDGEQSRDFTYVENVINANILAANVKFESGMFMNCAGHEQITLNTLLESINNILGKNVKAIYQTPRTGDVKHSFASIEKIKKKIGYLPSVNFEEGLKKTVNWYLKKT